MSYCKIKKDGTPAKKPGRKKIERSPKPFFDKRAPRPQMWVTGPDKQRHDMYMPFLRARAQAKFRSEGWELTFDNFCDIWKDNWNRRGRGTHSLCMARIDYEGDWTLNNVELIERKAHVVKQGKARGSAPKAVRRG